MGQLDLLAHARTPLPNEHELLRRFTEFSATYFQSKLPLATICWSARMRIAGTCQRHRALITLSRPYHERFPEDVDDTLKHEMIHLRYSGHGPAFRNLAARIGASLHCREYEGIHPNARLIYACPSCWREFRRMKAAELYCGRCAKGRLRPGCKLVLKRRIGEPLTGHRRTTSANGDQLRPTTRARANGRSSLHFLDLFRGN